jgi:hypothetical protein
MPGRFHCTLCDSVMEEQAISFVKESEGNKPAKIWTVKQLICKNEKCLIKRGATFVDYRTESRMK